MLLLFVAELPDATPANAAAVLQEFTQFNASLRPRKAGGYLLTVPLGRARLRTSRLLKEFCRSGGGGCFGVDDDGCPTIPISL